MKLYTRPFTTQQTKCQHKSKIARASLGALALLSAVLLTGTFTSCKQKTDNIVIWSSSREFASYVEAFNASHQNTKAILVYKEEPAASLPPSRNELSPDIVVGSWLKNSSTKKYFNSIDSIIKADKEGKIDPSIFYKTLFEYGKIGENSYLLPVSFNLPMVVFGNANEDLVGQDHLIGLESLKTSAAEFNSKNGSGDYTTMGYGASWNPELIYEFSKLRGTDYEEHGKNFSYEKEKLNEVITELSEWSKETNTSTTSELDFQFKYLFTPGYKQVTSGRCLYTFLTSDNFFKLKEEQVNELSFRWLGEEKKIPVEDDIVMIGLYRHSKNVREAEEFIIWLLKEQTQKELIERRNAMNLNTATFGLAGGFSSIRSVNETILPVYYRTMLENLPAEENLVLPNILPDTWLGIKQEVILPFIKDAVVNDREEDSEFLTMEQRISNWNKSNF